MFEGSKAFAVDGGPERGSACSYLWKAVDPLFGLSPKIKSVRIMSTFLPWKHDEIRTSGPVDKMKFITPASKNCTGKPMQFYGRVNSGPERFVQCSAAADEALWPDRRSPRRLVQCKLVFFDATVQPIQAAGSEA
jgi:hypothetical protein